MRIRWASSREASMLGGCVLAGLARTVLARCPLQLVLMKASPWTLCWSCCPNLLTNKSSRDHHDSQVVSIILGEAIISSGADTAQIEALLCGLEAARGAGGCWKGEHEQQPSTIGQHDRCIVSRIVWRSWTRNVAELIAQATLYVLMLTWPSAPLTPSGTCCSCTRSPPSSRSGSGPSPG